MSLLGDVTSPTTVAHYVSITWSEHREALTAAPTADGVHLQAIRVQGWRTQFATEQGGRLRYVTAVDGGQKHFPSVAWFAYPWSRLYKVWYRSFERLPVCCVAVTLIVTERKYRFGLILVNRLGKCLGRRRMDWQSSITELEYMNFCLIKISFLSSPSSSWAFIRLKAYSNHIIRWFSVPYRTPSLIQWLARVTAIQEVPESFPGCNLEIFLEIGL